MKIFSKLSALAIAALVLVSCAQAQQTETRNLDHFTKVHSGGSWEVVLKEGNSEEVKIEVKGVDMDKVKSEVEDGVLKLGLVNGSYRNVSVKFFVTYRELDGVKCSGSGEMEVLSDVEADDFEIGLSGSGDIILRSLVADRLEASISGSAEIKIMDGSVDYAEIKQSGSGDFEAEDLSIDELEVSKSGSGDTQVGDLGMISVRSSGSGDVVYSGSPRMGDIKVSGSSTIRKR